MAMMRVVVLGQLPRKAALETLEKKKEVLKLKTV